MGSRGFLTACGAIIAATALLTQPAAAALRAPTRAHDSGAAAVLPPSPCTLSGGTRSCELWAKTGTLALPGGTTVPIWGYAATAADPPTLPGPLLLATVGETVSITLHNTLADATSLGLPEQELPPDTAGAPPGGTRTYEFTATRPGTFRYEAGLTGGGPRQVAMGLAGALVVRPVSGNSAYGTAATAFDDEALVVLQGVDPAFNAAPATYPTAKYRPRYWLINGAAYPGTAEIPTAAGHRLLLRYVNAGLEDHPMSLAGAFQQVVGADGRALGHPYTVLSDTVVAGGTMDAIVSVPAVSRIPLFEAARHIDNAGHTTGGSVDFGGMLTFITTAGP
ncbi:multicopper oxidase domain-containing protein [Nonomuraea sp. M3C6]|uniref:Multicopper oxidase domain-containing protein n=1 Tax=Nonomuraea marmarensis TaxID=3351344 RepID=A0ABW7AQN5_9ACTN